MIYTVILYAPFFCIWIALVSFLHFVHVYMHMNVYVYMYMFLPQFRMDLSQNKCMCKQAIYHFCLKRIINQKRIDNFVLFPLFSSTIYLFTQEWKTARYCCLLWSLKVGWQDRKLVYLVGLGKYHLWGTCCLRSVKSGKDNEPMRE